VEQASLAIKIIIRKAPQLIINNLIVAAGFSLRNQFDTQAKACGYIFIRYQDQITIFELSRKIIKAKK
jgi:hypothetical protein